MLTDSDISNLIEIQPMFATLSDRLKGRVRGESGPVSVSQGTIVFTDGDACQAFLVVLSGSVRVSKLSPDGRELLLYYVNPGEFCVMTVGCLLGNRKYSATGETVAETTAIRIPASVFQELVAGSDEFRSAIFGLIGSRMGVLMQLVEEVAFQRLDMRLSSLLLSRSDRSGGAVIEATHQELAEDLGTSREIVSRVLESFEAQGLVALGRKRIEIINPTALPHD